MAERGGGSRGLGAQGRAGTVDTPRGAVAWPAGIALFPGARETLWRWLVAEVAPGRLMPWLPIAFGFGVALYFTAEREPAWWAALALAAACAAAAFAARARPIAFPLLLGCATVCGGICRRDTEDRARCAPDAAARGLEHHAQRFVEVQEERERTDRIVVRIHKIEGRLAPRRSACGSRCARAPRRRSAPSSR